LRIREVEVNATLVRIREDFRRKEQHRENSKPDEKVFRGKAQGSLSKYPATKSLWVRRVDATTKYAALPGVRGCSNVHVLLSTLLFCAPCLLPTILFLTGYNPPSRKFVGSSIFLILLMARYILKQSGTTAFYKNWHTVSIFYAPFNRLIYRVINRILQEFFLAL
jgi:hypothetical protein